jgi:hypothetical protein
MVAAAFVLLTAGACASPATVTTGGQVLSTSAPAAVHGSATAAPPAARVSPPMAPVSTVPIVALPPQPGSAVPASQIDTSGMTGTAPDSVQTTDGGTVVVFSREMSGCQKLSAQVTEQSATRVAILAITTTTSTAGQMCPMLVREVPVAVRLGAPLGNRTIVFTTTVRHN